MFPIPRRAVRFERHWGKEIFRDAGGHWYPSPRRRNVGSHRANYRSLLFSFFSPPLSSSMVFPFIAFLFLGSASSFSPRCSLRATPVFILGRRLLLRHAVSAIVILIPARFYFSRILRTAPKPFAYLRLYICTCIYGYHIGYLSNLTRFSLPFSLSLLVIPLSGWFQLCFSVRAYR